MTTTLPPAADPAADDGDLRLRFTSDPAASPLPLDALIDDAADRAARVAATSVAADGGDPPEAVRTAIERDGYVIVRSSGSVAEDVIPVIVSYLGTPLNPYSSVGVPTAQPVVSKGSSSPDQVWHWHTDSASWRRPNDYSVLYCVNPAERGGATDVLDFRAVLASGALSSEAVAVLSSYDVDWPIERSLGGGQWSQPVLGDERLRYRRELTTDVGRPALRAAIDELTRVIDECRPSVQALLEPGDALVFDNRRVLHRAGPCVDPERRRLLLRVKVRAG